MNRWLVVFGAVLVQFNLGCIFAWSVFTPDLAAAGWTRMETQVAFSVGLASFATTMVWAGRRLPVWGPRPLVWGGGLILGAGYLFAGLLGGTNFWAVTLCVGLLGGVGIGTAYVVPIAVGMRWFPDRKGLLSGLAVAGFGFGALGWVKLADSWGGLLAGVGLAGTFMIYGAVFAVLVFAGGLFMAPPPEGWMPPARPGAARASSPRTGEGGGGDFTRAEMARTPQFRLIAFGFLACTGAGLLSVGLMKLYPMEALQAAGMGAAEASVVAGTAMAVFFSPANGLGRIAWGLLSDRLGRRRLIQAMLFLQAGALVAFTAVAGREVPLYLAATVIGFNFGGGFSLFPAITADTFGIRNVGENYPLVFFFYGVGGIVFPILGGFLGDLGNFPLAFLICAATCVAGGVAIGRVRPAVRSSGDIRLE